MALGVSHVNRVNSNVVNIDSGLLFLLFVIGVTATRCHVEAIFFIIRILEASFSDSHGFGQLAKLLKLSRLFFIIFEHDVGLAIIAKVSQTE